MGLWWMIVAASSTPPWYVRAYLSYRVAIPRQCVSRAKPLTCRLDNNFASLPPLQQSGWACRKIAVTLLTSFGWGALACKFSPRLFAGPVLGGVLPQKSGVSLSLTLNFRASNLRPTRLRV